MGKPETETIDRLYLELSQFTTAKTKRELELEAERDELRAGLDKLARLGNEPHLGNSTGNRIAQRLLGSDSDE